jgi:hypothetical protein
MTSALAHDAVATGQSRRTRWGPDLAAVAVLLLLWAALWAPRLRGPIDLRWDASAYYILGTSLAEGRGYRLLNEPGAIEAVQYPPLLPLIVAAHQRVLGTSDYLRVAAGLRLTYCALSALYLLTVYLVARRFLPPPYALIVGTLTGLSFSAFLSPSDSLYAELPFGLVSMLFFVCVFERRRPGLAPASGVLAGAAYLLRTAGIALLAAWVAESLLRGRRREAAVRLLIAALPVLAWQVHVAQVTRSDDYRHPTYAYQRAPYYYANVTYAENGGLRDPFRPELGRRELKDLPVRIAENLRAVPEALAESAWIPSNSIDWFRPKVREHLGLELPPGAALVWVLTAIGGVMAVGALRFAARGEWLLALYFGATVGLICLTPWPGQFWRYLAALAPITLLFFVDTLLAAGRRLLRTDTPLGRTAGSLVVAAPLAGMLLLGTAVASEMLRHCPTVTTHDPRGGSVTYRPLIYPADWPPLDAAFEWVRRHAAPKAVIASAVPHMSYLRTGHPSVLPPFELRPDSALRLMDQIPVSYVVLDAFDEPGVSRRYAEPAVESRPDRWRLAYTAPDGRARVYERTR